MIVGVDASRATRPQRTGTERYSIELVRRLPSSMPKHTLRFYTDRPPTREVQRAQGSTEWRVMPFPRLWTHVRLSTEMVRHPPDVLFVPAHVIPLAHPRHCVVTVHDLGYLLFPEAHTRLGRWYLDISTRWNARVATRVLALSEATRHDLERYYGVDPAKVSVVYPGCDVDRFRPGIAPQTVDPILERYGISGRYVLYLGTLQPRKNLVRLVEAFAQIDEPDVTMVLAGRRGWLSEPIFRRVRELHLEGRVRFPGYVEEQHVPPLLAGAEVFAFPSLYEGFGLPVLEAMACGTPVVCSKAAGWAEALRTWLHDEALGRELAHRGIARARAFSWDSCARRVAEAILALEEQSTRARGAPPGMKTAR